MLNTRHFFAALLLLLLGGLVPVRAGRDIYAPGLTMRQEGGNNIVVWEASKPGFELARSVNLLSWTAQAPPALAAGRQTWTLPEAGPREFFRLRPDGPPVAPGGLLAVWRGDRLYLRWEEVPNAEFFHVYISSSAPAGPGNFDKSLENLCANEVEVTGLVAGQAYCFAVLGVNERGTGPAGDTVCRVFGPASSITGRVIVSCPEAGQPEPFVVPVAGMALSLERMPEKVLVGAGVTGRGGRFSLTEVPPGSYRLGVPGQQGWLETYSPTFVLGYGGIVLDDIVLMPGSAGNGMAVGSVTDSDGRPFVVDLFDPTYAQRLKVKVLDHTGAVVLTRILAQDTNRFAINDIPPAAYPITVRAEFKSLHATLPLASVAEKGPLRFVLTNDPPYFAGAYVSRDPSPDPAREVRCGDVLTGHATVKTVSQKPYTVRWVVEFPAGNVLYDTTDDPPQFAFTQPQSGIIHFRVIAESDGLPSTTEFTLPYDCSGTTCLSGAVTVWDSGLPRYQQPVAGAAVTIKSTGGTEHAVTANANGAFDFASLPVLTTPVLRIQKAGYVPWSWKFDATPQEGTYGMVPTTTLNAVVDNAAALTIELPGNHVLILPPDSLKRADGTVFSGGLRVEAGTWEPALQWQPFPHLVKNPSVPVPTGMSRLLTAVWIQLRDVAEQPLAPQDGGAGFPKLQHAPDPALFAPGGLIGENTPASIAVVRRFEDQGVFGEDRNTTVQTGGAIRYEHTLEQTGLYGLRSTVFSLTLTLPTDKTIVYPFSVLLGNSAFPIHVYSPAATNIGPLKISLHDPIRISVLHLRQSPGDYYDDYSSGSSLPVAPYAKMVIQQRDLTGADIAAPVTAAVLGLSGPLPALRTTAARSDVPVAAIDGENSFFAPYPDYQATTVVPGESIGQTYYRLIGAPESLALWRQGNGLNPVNPTLPPPNVSQGDWTTAFYYNQADLGFARRLSLRTVPSSGDKQPNVAMEVTNFRTLEDARCNKSALASVCMEYTSKGDTPQPRYVKFYTYGANGALLDRVSLDGRAPKMMPNLCVVCHGGQPFGADQNPNLGSSFLPFDLESFTTLRIHGQQRDRIAKLNHAVLQTQPSGAITDLIHGWYGGAPLANETTFHHDYISGFVPPGNPAAVSFAAGGPDAHAFYLGTFRNSCRVCHISREGGLNFDNWSTMQAMLPASRNAVGRLMMPAAPRTFGILWGTRAAHTIDPSVTDLPAQIFAPGSVPLVLPPGR